MFGVGKNFNVFERRLQDSIYLDQKYSKNKNILKYYYNLKWLFSILIHFKMSVISLMGKLKSIITPVFTVTWSFRNILICWFAAQETFHIIINVENS